MAAEINLCKGLDFPSVPQFNPGSRQGPVSARNHGMTRVGKEL